MTITSFDKQNLRTMRTEIEIALKAVSDKYGVNFDVGRITFSDSEFRGKLTCTTRAPAPAKVVTVVTPTNNSMPSYLESMCIADGIDINGRSPQGHTLVDYRPSNRKMPYIIVSKRGTRYKISREQARSFFPKQIEKAA